MERTTPTGPCCSFAITGDRPFIQDVYVCRTCCPPTDDETPSAFLGLCQSCAVVCHKDHDVQFLGTGKAYCDCSQIQQGCRIAEASEEFVRSLWPEDEEERLLLDDTKSIQITRGEQLAASGESINVSEQPDEFIRDAYMIDQLSASLQNEENALVEMLQAQASELILHSKETFWIDSDEMESEITSLSDQIGQNTSRLCALERLACRIAKHHTDTYNVQQDEDDTTSDNKNSRNDSWKGLEWWVQVKTLQFSNSDSEEPRQSESVDLHYDKDEELAEHFGLGIFPTLSTVTYLTGGDDTQPQSPTLVFPRCYHDSPDDGDMLNMWISQPKCGKHVVFDGRLLHGAPSHPALRRRTTTAAPTRNHLRITFLVNLWKNRRPAGIKSLPDGIREKLLPLESDNAVLQSTKLSWECLPYETIRINEEPERERIPLPFVSGTSADDTVDDEGDQEETSGMDVMAFAPLNPVEETALVVYSEELGAYFEETQEDLSTSVVLDKIKALCESENWSVENEALVCGLLLCTRIEDESAFLDKLGFSKRNDSSDNRFQTIILTILSQTAALESKLFSQRTQDDRTSEVRNASLTRLASQILSRALMSSSGNQIPAEFVRNSCLSMQNILQLRRKRRISIGVVDIELLFAVQNCFAFPSDIGISKQDNMAWIWSIFMDSLATLKSTSDTLSVSNDHKLMIDTIEALLDQTKVWDLDESGSHDVTWRGILFESLQKNCADVKQLPHFWTKAVVWWGDLPKSQRDKSANNQLSPKETAHCAWLLLYIIDSCGEDVDVPEDAWLPLSNLLLAVTVAATDHVASLRLLAWTVTCRIWPRLLQKLGFDRAVCSLLKLSAGETKIQLESLLRLASSLKQRPATYANSLLRICSQITSQTVETLSELEEESMAIAGVGEKGAKQLSKNSIQNVRHSLESSLDTCVQYFQTQEAQTVELNEVTTIMISMFGSLLTEFDIFLQDTTAGDEDRIESLVQTLDIAMTLAKAHLERACLIFPAVASVLASAQGDESRISVIRNVLETVVELVDCFWRSSSGATFNHESTVSWVCHTMEILNDIMKPELGKLNEWKQYLISFLGEAVENSVSASEGAQAAAGCYICLQGENPSDEESLLIHQIIKQDEPVKNSVPESLCSAFGTYPNPLQLTQTDRDEFSAVVQFPRNENGKLQYRVLDHTKPWEDNPTQLLSDEEHRIARERALSTMTDADTAQPLPQEREDWFFGVGRYDEDRRGMYESDLFAVENPEEQRTVHVGIDLDGPVGTPVHAFFDGTVQSVGYNAPLGDYGNVIVIEHSLPRSDRVVYALYGHLDGTVVQNWTVGQFVRKGQVIAGMGAPFENGGWKIPHVHFQLSVQKPETHDLPGAVAPKDRSKALYEYPDPRYILGELY